MHVVATRRDERTIVDTLRQEGLARCSRPFALPSGGARLVTAQLGPGYVRGDRFLCDGSVGARAELAVTPQAATRALGRGAESVATARWRVGAGGTLRLLGEPLVVYAGACHSSATDVELERGAALVYLDVIVANATFERITTRLRVRTAERRLVHDALRLTPDRFAGAVGTAFVLRAESAAVTNETLAAAADSAAREASARYAVRIGVGRPACGGISLRALGEGAASVQAALHDVIDRLP